MTRDITGRKPARHTAQRKLASDLRKRIKELDCLYGISRLVATPGISLEQTFQEIADLLPPAWQYPEVACTRIVFDHQEFKTENFRETPWRQVSDVKVRGERIGSMEVCYLEERPESEEGPFLKEERSLLNAVAERLGRIVERKRAEGALRKRIKELNCLYDISKLRDTPGISLEQIFLGTADLLPPAWEYPEIACARIVLEEQEFKTENFRETPWRQASDIKAHGQPIGSVEVFYLEERPESDEGPFLEEERSLVNAVAERLGRIFERMRAEEALRAERDRAQKYLDVAEVIFVAINTKGQVTLINPKGCAVLGYEDKDILGKNWFNLLLPAPIRREVRAVFRKLMAGEIEPAEYYENPVRTRSGDERLIAWHNAVLRDDAGNIVGTLSSGEDVTERMRAEEELRERTHDLGKRVKELDCLYGIAGLRETRGISLEQIFRGIADLLPPAWEYPEVACARIVLEDQEFKTENYRETPWRQTSDIKAHGQPIGSVEVCYLEERPESDEGPFLEEERSLVNAVAERLGRIVERRRAEEALRERTRQLVDMPGISLEQMLQRAADLIPPSWQYPDIACARIVLEDKEFKTENFKETPWRQASDIRLRGERIGSVEVCYLEERPESDEGPFLQEERSLISAVAERLSRIVEIKRTEEKVQAEQQRLSVLVDTSPVGVFAVEAESGRASFVNREARRILGLPGDPSERREQVAVYRRPDGRAYAVEELPPVRALYRGEQVSAEEVLLEFADGRTVPTLVNATPIYSSDGKITGAISVIQDITPLEEAEKLRSEFLGVVGHELRTPLTAIKGAAATMLGSPEPLSAEETRVLFQVIDEQADRLRDLVSNLLDMTRIEAGRLSVSPGPTDLHAILEEARASFIRSGSPQALEITVPDDLPPVKADPGRIVQVVSNLLANAAKLSPPTAPIVVDVEHDALSATLHVRDQGRGIAKEKLHHLFKKFARLHEDEGQRLSGTGLGLAICKGIVEAHGGRIWAESAGEGEGATFSFTIPITSVASVTSLSDAARGAVHQRKVTRRGERTRVLAVDDEPQILRYFQRTLNEEGYEATVTSDPSQVARLVEAEEPDLILLDLIIPGTSGFDLLRQIREFSNVPVIIVTASEREEDTVQALKMGADDYITKPFSPSELFARMEAALRRRVSLELLEERPPLALGDLRIDFAERRVTVGGRPISLSATEYKLLYELAIHAGRVLTHDQLLQRVWGSEYEGETGVLRSFIVLLRRKLGDDARRPRFIFTELGVGYRIPRP